MYKHRWLLPAICSNPAAAEYFSTWTERKALATLLDSHFIFTHFPIKVIFKRLVFVEADQSAIGDLNRAPKL